MNIAIITARGGSKRIPHKNIRDFCGKPIIEYSIRAALDAQVFDTVMVSTDDERIALIAKNAGAEDFQNDAQFVGGCIAGGRRYLHINAKGDVEPCVFIHYSNANIHDCSLLDALKSPLFQAYHDNQPFNDNMLRPCPMLENPDKLGEMVKESKAVNTDYQSPETPEHLKEKAAPYAENWTPTAEKLWNKEKEKIAAGKAGVEQ